MKLSTRGRYALRLMLDIARNYVDGTPVSLTSVVERTGLSRGYLEQLAMALRTAGLLRGIAGRHGGYQLARPLDKIHLNDILEATIGPICIVNCIDEPETCLKSNDCECRLVYSLINDRIAQVLAEYSLADLLNEDRLAELRMLDETAAVTRSARSRGGSRSGPASSA